MATNTHIPVRSARRCILRPAVTKFLFATAYDGAWDPYIEDFATKIPDEMDVIFSAFQAWPGIRSPKVKDWIVEHQVAGHAVIAERGVPGDPVGGAMPSWPRQPWWDLVCGPIVNPSPVASAPGSPVEGWACRDPALQAPTAPARGASRLRFWRSGRTGRSSSTRRASCRWWTCPRPPAGRAARPRTPRPGRPAAPRPGPTAPGRAAGPAPRPPRPPGPGGAPPAGGTPAWPWGDHRTPGPGVAAQSRARPGRWLRWLAPAPQWPMSSSPASATQNQSQPVTPRPGVYSST